MLPLRAQALSFLLTAQRRAGIGLLIVFTLFWVSRKILDYMEIKQTLLRTAGDGGKCAWRKKVSERNHILHFVWIICCFYYEGLRLYFEVFVCKYHRCNGECIIQRRCDSDWRLYLLGTNFLRARGFLLSSIITMITEKKSRDRNQYSVGKEWAR